MITRILILSSLLIVFSSFACNVICQTEHEFRIIVNTSADITALSKQKLRAIFSRNIQYWENGSPIKVFVLPNDHLIHKGFTKSRLGFYPYQLQRNWDRLSYSTMAITPTAVNSKQEMILAINKNKGAIGYIASVNLLHGNIHVQTF